MVTEEEEESVKVMFSDGVEGEVAEQLRVTVRLLPLVELV